MEAKRDDAQRRARSDAGDRVAPPRAVLFLVSHHTHVRAGLVSVRFACTVPSQATGGIRAPREPRLPRSDVHCTCRLTSRCCRQRHPVVSSANRGYSLKGRATSEWARSVAAPIVALLVAPAAERIPAIAALSLVSLAALEAFGGHLGRCTALPRRVARHHRRSPGGGGDRRDRADRRRRDGLKNVTARVNQRAEDHLMPMRETSVAGRYPERRAAPAQAVPHTTGAWSRRQL